MANIPVGTIIHNVEMKVGAGAQIARSAGTYVQLIGKDQGFAQLLVGFRGASIIIIICIIYRKLYALPNPWWKK